MKKLFLSTGLLVFILFFYACPLGTNVPPAKPNSEKLDAKLIGSWTNPSAPDFTTAHLVKLDDFSFEASLEGSALDDDIIFKGWSSTINSQKIVYVFDETLSEYLTYAYTINRNSLELKEFDLTIDEIKEIQTSNDFVALLTQKVKKRSYKSSYIYTKK